MWRNVSMAPLTLPSVLRVGRVPAVVVTRRPVGASAAEQFSLRQTEVTTAAALLRPRAPPGGGAAVFERSICSDDSLAVSNSVYMKEHPEQSVSQCLFSLLGFWNKLPLHQNGLNKHRAPQMPTGRP
ncbi:hypothetical protein EYF80_006900 [Liparis tanakae]|uniref:Uncharacterized protein n=1 Tax=Liparis tanakae TaxID=230148 RepID=A0A4Z2J0G4_9TELE|nr:hypothetical protein EYF80_006900 [Liparis tanakae]